MEACEGNEFSPSNLNFIIPIPLQPDGVNLWCFKRRLSNLRAFIVYKIIVVSTSGCNDTGIFGKDSIPLLKLFHSDLKTT